MDAIRFGDLEWVASDLHSVAYYSGPAVADRLQPSKFLVSLTYCFFGSNAPSVLGYGPFPVDAGFGFGIHGFQHFGWESFPVDAEFDFDIRGFQHFGYESSPVDAGFGFDILDFQHFLKWILGSR